MTETSQSATVAPAVQNAGWMRRLLPWVVSLAVASWLLWPYRTAHGRGLLVDAFARASGWTLALAIVAPLCLWLTDCYATARTFQRWGTAITLRETCLIRGATALFDVINPALGQAVLTIVVHRRGTPWRQALVLVLVMNVIFLVQIALVSGLGLVAGEVPESGIVALLAVGALALTVVYVGVVALRPALFERNRTLAWLADMGLRGHAWAFLYRLPNTAALIGWQVLLMRCFGIELPLTVALFYLPPMMFIAGMPISVQGIGPGQLAAVAFFAGYVGGDRAAAEATVLACGFAGTAMTTLGAVVIGLSCLSTDTGRQSLAAVRDAAPR
jgi:Lysylphosphatidylglycerol synthase TM region